jgi:secretion/DNA translocation related CpaE-like protein
MKTSPSPLVVTTDQTLREELVRLAAAAGVVPEIAGSVGSALRSWPAAPLVLVGGDLAGAVAAAGPPRRAGIHLVAAHESSALYRAALACGAESVRCLPADADALTADLTDCGDGARTTGAVVGVIGGAGGVGSTVFAAALAEVLATDRDVLLVDADPAGAGIDRVLGTESLDGVRWDGLVQAAGRLSARSLRDALPRRARLSVLTWSSVHVDTLSVEAARSAISTGRRGYPVVVVDLARRVGPAVDDLLLRCDHLVLVTTTTVPAVSAAVRLAGRLPAVTGLVLRGSGGGVAPEEVAQVLGLPVLARMRDQRGLDEAIGLGLGPVRRRGPLVRAARAVATAVVPQARA